MVLKKDALVIATKDSSVLSLESDRAYFLNTSTVHPKGPSKALFMLVWGPYWMDLDKTKCGVLIGSGMGGMKDEHGFCNACNGLGMDGPKLLNFYCMCHQQLLHIECCKPYH